MTLLGHRGVIPENDSNSLQFLIVTRAFEAGSGLVEQSYPEAFVIGESTWKERSSGSGERSGEDLEKEPKKFK